MATEAEDLRHAEKVRQQNADARSAADRAILLAKKQEQDELREEYRKLIERGQS